MNCIQISILRRPNFFYLRDSVKTLLRVFINAAAYAYAVCCRIKNVHADHIILYAVHPNILFIK